MNNTKSLEHLRSNDTLIVHRVRWFCLFQRRRGRNKKNRENNNSFLSILIQLMNRSSQLYLQFHKHKPHGHCSGLSQGAVLSVVEQQIMNKVTTLQQEFKTYLFVLSNFPIFLEFFLKNLHYIEAHDINHSFYLLMSS